MNIQYQNLLRIFSKIDALNLKDKIISSTKILPRTGLKQADCLS